MKHLFLLGAGMVCLAALVAPAAAQPFSVSGRVVDEHGAPVVGATVFVTKALPDTPGGAHRIVATTAAFDVTGPDGTYAIGNVNPGRYAVVAYLTGKRIATQHVTVADHPVRADFTLSLLETELGEITVREPAEASFALTRLRPVDVEGVALYEAKKSEVVVIDELTANLATNNSRQIYGRVAGLNIWESDGAGLQLGLGGRGLSPNRNANFNTRQNGYDIAADALGYPESYYTPPTEALSRIEIVRGAASLQYGTQFGGLLNFVFKDGPETKPVEVTSRLSTGSFGLLNTFTSIGGTAGPTRYYGFYQYKRSDGWRPNAELDQHTAYAALTYRPLPALSIRPEYTYMYYLAHQPGGLTDAQFEANPRQSTRERNWFRVHWNLFALRADYRFSSRTSLNTRFFGLLAGRDALGNLGRIDRLDLGGNRDLLKDDYRNWGNETRLIHRYPFLHDVSVLLVGTRIYRGFTHRRQGEGPDGRAPDFTYLNPDNLEGSDFDLPSRNVSVFAENIFNVTPRLSVTPGIRFEYIRTQADGYYRNTVRDLAGNVLLDERIEERRSHTRSFVFFGIGLSYKPASALEVYANFSQNYRAINFNDIRVNVGSLEVDPDIRDEHGFNLDLGLRGTHGRVFTYDVSLFHLFYRDRIGTVLRTAPNPQFNNLVDRTFRFRTNIADARIYGIESFAELDLYKVLAGSNSPTRLSVFSNLALISAKYARSRENGIAGNDVELVPPINLKTGLTFSTGPLAVAYQFSYVGKHFSDASNALRTPTAIEGIIPAYHVMDLSAAYTFGRYRLEAGVNNLTDHHYFTRRATGYPGPGIIPAEGRSLYLTLGLTL
ncbi:TonB-dependent receptor [Rhodocaloribacter litoris]|uniref:TonB-dependent receptor n=1 Tax=Rhodocaloribacter litoris TaxID=2558931 RepID=UPI00141FE3B6|nr:TonB-dependent receptor [Rhodocaloribacter litoris]QXD16126.1 TonB-dependent receptor [Rhodocaloribacter litoris]GIV59859.1 MAG: TonB-dependent receptor [Rhodothermaceae bacterium]